MARGKKAILRAIQDILSGDEFRPAYLDRLLEALRNRQQQLLPADVIDFVDAKREWEERLAQLEA